MSEIPLKSVNPAERNMLRDVLSYIPALLIPALLNIVTLLIFPRLFSLETYGQWILVLNTLNIGTGIVSQWLGQSVQRYLPLYQAREEEALFLHFLLLFLLLFFTSLLIAALGFYVPFFALFSDWRMLYWPLFGLMLFQSLFFLLSALFQSNFKVRMYRICQIAVSILKLAFALGLLVFVSRSVNAVIYGYLLALVLVCAPMVRASGMRLRPPPMIDYFQAFRFFGTLMLRYGMPMIGWLIGTLILTGSDRYLIQWLLDTGAVGIYGGIYALVAGLVNLCAAPLLVVAHPVLMRAAEQESDDELQLRISGFSRYFLLIAVPLLAFAIVFHAETVQVFLGEEFSVYSPLMPLLTAGMLIWNFALYGQKGHEIKNRTLSLMIIVWLSALFNIVFNIDSIRSYGIYAAGISALSSFVVYILLIYLSSRKILAWRLKEVLTARLAFVFIVSVMLLFALRIGFLLPLPLNPFAVLSIGGFLFIFLYPGLLAVFGVLTDDEREIVKRSIGRFAGGRSAFFFKNNREED
ncbi:lipopolysaccharide biosynthesis protein [Saccharibacillus sp. CPCC 101409]|uniref:lipopolysaccharide biosynthesis protein n=1 Tax=Saccharibacillus sp. CPCC 101409 TaxID=3058041 RepID=UPI002674071A|nr:lipopolysaccharide biosynthesis protein [Saccharibacillus sp. CPCC 101409]MDO3412028.1 lipopolysaccharide biosynthesis protein [Saccharibacillus sp. CPCC 101409]